MISKNIHRRQLTPSARAACAAKALEYHRNEAKERQRAAGGRDNYKIWEEGQVPTVIFEITSPSTQLFDTGFKKDLYAQMGVKEYWLFDPKGEWLEGQLQGFCLNGEEYVALADLHSQELGLSLSVENKKIALHRLDNGEKLPFPEELAEQVTRERQAKQELEAMLQRYRERYGDLEA